jgi:hypothetical protein
MKREEARRLYEILKESELLASPHQPSEETKSEAPQCVKRAYHKETNTPEANSKLLRSLDRHPETSFKGTSYPVPSVLSSVKKHSTPLSLKRSRLQTFLNRFDRRAGTKSAFKKESLRGTTATTPKQKMFLVTLQRKTQQLKDYIGPPLTSTLSVRALHRTKIDVSTSPTAPDLLQALTPHYRH